LQRENTKGDKIQIYKLIKLQLLRIITKKNFKKIEELIYKENIKYLIV